LILKGPMRQRRHWSIHFRDVAQLGVLRPIGRPQKHIRSPCALVGAKQSIL
jgi:hypothetical protein